MLHPIKLQRPGSIPVFVNPLHVGAVETLPDRTGRCTVHVGSVQIRVMGSVEETLALLGWTPLVDMAPVVPASISAGRSPAQPPMGSVSDEL